MKKITPFLFALPLVLFSIYLGFSQMKSKAGVPPSRNTAQVNTDQVSPSAQTPTITPQTTQAGHIDLIVSSPVSGSTVDVASTIVSGTAGANIHIIINDQELLTKSDGSFKSTVNLDEGDNYISIVAYDDLGNSAEREILVTRTVSDL